MEDTQYYAPDMNRLNALLIVLGILFGSACTLLLWMWSQL